jgi:hypothetical protein
MGQYVRQVLDHFELRHSDHNYHFVIHEPLGVSVQSFSDIAGERLPISYIKNLAFRMLLGYYMLWNYPQHSSHSCGSDLFSSSDSFTMTLDL